MSDESQTPKPTPVEPAVAPVAPVEPIVAAAAPPSPAVAEPAPQVADDPVIVGDMLDEVAVDPTGGVWRCLNEQCPEAKLGATFLAPTQETVRATGVHPICPGCNNEPRPFYAYVGPNEASKNAATAA